MWDNLASVNNNLLFHQFFFYTDYQDFFVSVLHHSPELVLALKEFYNSEWVSSVMSYIPSSTFDVFNDSMTSSTIEFINYLLMFMFFSWTIIFTISAFRGTSAEGAFSYYLSRIGYWIYSASKETRFQFEAALKAFFLYFLYTAMMIAAFDDDEEEVIELFNIYMFNFFLLTVVYYLFRSSIHFFSILEPTSGEGRTIQALANQFRRDAINFVSFFLRMTTLIARLNIYDINDDILDSYYIFVGDFNDDEYFTDLFFSIFSILFYDSDNNDDRSFFLEDEVDTGNDLFTLYFIVWGKLVFFIAFILEEIARISLALYIIYSTILELQSLNRSYLEDNYLGNKRFDSFSATTGSISKV
jgi:hypothetical protein